MLFGTVAHRGADTEVEVFDESTTREIVFREGDFLVKTISDDEERIQAYRLRHRVFCEELGWVPRSETLLEIDEYDRCTVLIGIFDQQQALVACTRLSLRDAPFMIEKEFSSLISPWHKVKKNETTEITRSCVRPEHRRLSFPGTFGSYRLSMLSFKGVYHWCLMNHIKYAYIVVESKFYRLLAHSFPIQLVGTPVVMPDGCMALAAIFDLSEVTSTITANRPDFAKWFSRYQSDRLEAPQRQPDFWSPPQASA